MNEDLTGGFRLQPDPDEVRAFCALIHGQAQRATDGLPDPGLIQVTKKHPAYGGLTLVGRYAVGESERMAVDALIEASNGFNVYIEGRTVPKTLGKLKRGDASETAYVFALVVDADDYKGRGSRIDIAASLVVESSGGGAHLWLFFDRALKFEQVARHGEALRRATGADSKTGDVAQPFRVAGTPNYYDADKRNERGCDGAPTKVLEHTTHVWTLEDLQRVFPPVERVAPLSGRPQGGSGVRVQSKIDRAEQVLALPYKQGTGNERLFLVWKLASEGGLNLDEIEELALKYWHNLPPRFQNREKLRKDIHSVVVEKPSGKPPVVEHVEPTHPDRGVPVAEARHDLGRVMHCHYKKVATYSSWLAIGGAPVEPPRTAIKVDPGVGKTTFAIEFTRWLLDNYGPKAPPPTIHFTRNHKIAEQTAQDYCDAGIKARVYRGRNRPDPDQPDKGMCHKPTLTKEAHKLGLNVKKSCCIGKDAQGVEKRCEFFGICGHSIQPHMDVQVWVVPIDYLFLGLEGVRKVLHIIVDEGVIDKAIKAPSYTTLQEFVAPAGIDPVFLKPFQKLVSVLGQCPTGDLARQTLIDAGLTVDECRTSSAVARATKRDEIKAYPGMSKADWAVLAETIRHNRSVSRLAHVFLECERLLQIENDEFVSGRLFVIDDETPDGRVRKVGIRNVRTVAPVFQAVPVLHIDATMAPMWALNVIFPGMTLEADIRLKMPSCVAVRQVKGSPTTMTKMGFGDHISDKDRKTGENNRQRLLQAIMSRWAEFGQQKTLVVTTLKMRKWLQAPEQGLPGNIHVEHYGVLEGINAYKDVRLLILLGVDSAKPQDVENIFAALTGDAPERLPIELGKFTWFQRRVAGIRTPQGGVAVDVECHPDPRVEELRYQSREGGAVQGIGRARGAEPDRAVPLQIDIMADIAIDMTVHEITEWATAETRMTLKKSCMVLAGVMLETPAHMARAFPEQWKNTKAAENHKNRNGARTPSFSYIRNNIQANEGVLPDGWVIFEYKLEGRGHDERLGAVNLSICPDPRLWLEERLGPLAHFEIDQPPVVIDEGAEREREPAEPSRANQNAPAEIVSRMPPVVDGPSPPPPR